MSASEMMNSMVNEIVQWHRWQYPGARNVQNRSKNRLCLSRVYHILIELQFHNSSYRQTDERNDS